MLKNLWIAAKLTTAFVGYLFQPKLVSFWRFFKPKMFFANNNKWNLLSFSISPAVKMKADLLGLIFLAISLATAKFSMLEARNSCCIRAG